MRSTWKGLTVGLWLLGATVWADLDSRLDEHWELWKKSHQRVYQNKEDEMSRRALWEKNVMQINTHNQRASQGLHSYTMAINHLSDLTEEELLQIIAPLKVPGDFQMIPTPVNVTNVALPDSVDWRQQGYVTSVKNQGSKCGSCYAFSAVGALEGLLAKTRGRLEDLSPQNLVDCTRLYGNFGCGGGWMHTCFQYVIKNDGIDSETSYPYQAVDGQCRYDSNRAATCSSYHFLPKDEVSLQQAVATIGPISVLIDSSTMSSYSSGVFYNTNCGQMLRHAVLVIGYGTDQASGLDYWLIKNSWGTDWGENGYLRLARNKNQMCGISLHSVYPQ